MDKELQLTDLGLEHILLQSFSTTPAVTSFWKKAEISITDKMPWKQNGGKDEVTAAGWT